MSETLREMLIGRIREEARQRGLSIRAVEEAAGLSRHYLDDALSGRKRLTLELVDLVIGQFGLTPADFLAGEALASAPAEDSLLDRLSRLETRYAELVARLKRNDVWDVKREARAEEDEERVSGAGAGG